MLQAMYQPICTALASNLHYSTLSVILSHQTHTVTRLLQSINQSMIPLQDGKVGQHSTFRVENLKLHTSGVFDMKAEYCICHTL